MSALRNIDAYRGLHRSRTYPYQASYCCLHIPTGKRVIHHVAFLSRQHMLELLEWWNSQQPTRWKYWQHNPNVIDYIEFS